MNKDVLKDLKDVINLSDPGKLFQSKGALNLNERLPLSLKMRGTLKDKNLLGLKL